MQIRLAIQSAMDAGAIERGRVRIRRHPFAGPTVDVIRGAWVIRVQYEERDSRFGVSVSPRRFGVTLWWRRVDAAKWVTVRGGGTVESAPSMIEDVVRLLALIDRTGSHGHRLAADTT